MARKWFSLTVVALSALLVASSCTVQGQVHASYRGAQVIELVELRPGLWVAVDYPRPVFFSNGYYWMYRNGQWLRSYTYYSGDWVIVHYRYVPPTLRYLDRPPRYYVRYQPRPERPRYVAPRVRDHRTEEARAPQPRVRDHRGTDRDERPRVRDHRGGEPSDRARERPSGERDEPRVRDHRERGDDRDTRSRQRGREGDDEPRVRDHRGRDDDRNTRSRQRGRDRD